MFNLLDRYIARQVIYASLFVLFLLVVLRCLFSLIDELADIGKGGYQISDVFLYVGLMIPMRLLEFFPMSVLIGALFAMGSLATNSELTVMRASGVTTWRIAGSTIKASIILMLFVVLIGEWISPIASKAAQQLRTSAISGGDLSFSKTGIWAKQKNLIVQMGNLLADGQVRDITLYQLSDDNQLQGIVKATSATTTGDHWLLRDVTEILFLPDRIEQKNTESLIWNSPLQTTELETLTLDPETLNLSGLLSYIDYLQENDLNSQVFELAVWSKIMQPLAIGVMMFLAVSFVFGPMRNVSMGARMLSGVMLGFGFHVANQSFGPISLVFNVYPFIGASIPLLMFGYLGYWLMKRNQ